ncbi:MAG: LamG-like jellyroll fold domain-containing protein [Micavibrio sp.]
MIRFLGLVFIALLAAGPAYAACATPAGAGGDIVYNTTENVFQFCNDTDWVSMHVPGSGSGGCTNPTFDEGRLVYSSEHRMLQGCAGTQWKGIGKPPAKSWTVPALAHSLASPVTPAMFGRSVSISGNLIALGAPSQTIGGFTNAGQAYVYNATTGALVSTLVNPQLTATDRMGRTGIGISGNLVVVGAFDDDPGGLSSAGSAYVYNATTGALVSTLNPPSQAAGDLFGTSTAISGDLVAVGATEAAANDAGEAYVFNATTGALVSTLVNPNASVGDNFGVNIAISGNLVVVGDNFDDPGAVSAAGSAYIFNATTGALITTLVNPAPTANDRFGESVAIEGNLVVVTALFDDAGTTDAGIAYVFNAMTGALISTLNNPDPTTADEFGGRGQLGLSNGIVVLGAQFDDSVGTTDAGVAYVYDAMTGALLATLNNPDPTTNDSYGFVTSLSGDTAVISAYQDDPGALSNAGSVYVFKATLPAEANCANPAGTPGSIVYTSQHNVLEYCNGARWSAVGKAPTVIVSSGLVGYWKFDEISGTTAADSSGNGNTGTLTNMDGATDWVAGHVGNALDFDGTNDFVNAGSAAVLDNLGPVSGCVWAYPRTTGGSYPTLMDKSSTGYLTDGWGFITGHSGGSYDFGYYNIAGDGKDGGAAATIPMNTWSHLCFTWDGTAHSGGNPTAGIKFYMNGVEVHAAVSAADYNPAFSDAAHSLRIGSGGANAYPFKGVIDEVRLYNRVLTLGEIQLLAAE